MSKGSGPATPNYTQAAQQQGASSQQVSQTATQQAHPNQTSAWGSSEWTYDPTTQQYTQNVSLSPQEQSILNAQQGGQLTQQQLAGQYGGAVQGSGLLNPITTQIPTSASIDPQAESAAWNEYNTVNAPIFQQQTSQLQTQLADQGLRPGDAAYETAMQNLESNQNTANSNAASEAYLTGVQSGATQQGEDINALNANLGEQSQGVNLLNSLLGATQVTNPYANTQTQVFEADPTQYLQAAQDQGQADLNAYNASQAGMNSLLGGLGKGLGMLTSMA